MTLPDSTLEGLEQIDADRGRAIVKLTRAALRDGPGAKPLVEVVEVAAHTGLIIVGPSKALQRIPFLHLVEVAPARFLLALDPGNDFQNLEIAVRDALEELPAAADERKLLSLLLEHIRSLRRSDRVRMAQILLIQLQSNHGG